MQKCFYAVTRAVAALIIAAMMFLSCAPNASQGVIANGEAQNNNKAKAKTYRGNSPVLISEIYSANNDHKDEHGETPGWVEFYNPNDVTVKLNGYYLTDNAKAAPKRWAFVDVIVHPKSYLLVFMSGRKSSAYIAPAANDDDLGFDIAAYRSASNIHASFTLNKDGGKLFLTDDNGKIRESVTYPAQTSGVSYARNVEYSAKSPWKLCLPPTPGGTNSSVTYDAKQTQQAASSQQEMGIPKSGHYAKAQSFIIPHGENGATIACDMTGALPTEKSSLRSGSKVTIGKNSIIRCIQFKDGAQTSEPIMRTYIIGRLPALPIVSIAVDPKEMFDNTRGLYSKGPNASPNIPYRGANFWSNTELPVQIEFFENGMEPGWSRLAGLRIVGNYSRAHRKKSVSLTFRDKYDKQGRLEYRLLPDNPELTHFKQFILRCNGNNFERDYFRDMLMTSLSEGLGIDYQRGRAAVVYYNGDYWGIHNIRERMNSDYFSTKYGAGYNKKNIEMAKTSQDTVRRSDNNYSQILDWLESLDGLSDDDLLELDKRVDIDNYTNQFMVRMYYYDRDWPGNNMRRWRTLLPPSRWKWIMQDTDHGWGSYGTWNQPSVSTMRFVMAENGPIDHPTWPNPPYSTFLFRKLMQNEGYRISFINRFSLLMATYFAEDRVTARINALFTAIESEIPHDQQRWNHNKNKMNNEMNTIRSFNARRKKQMQDELESYFKLGRGVDISVSVNDNRNGTIRVHNMEVLGGSAAFKAYPAAPVALTAVPKNGAIFEKWSDGVTDPERVVPVNPGQAPVKLIAFFKQ